MLVRKGEVNQMYCPFKFSHPLIKESGRINLEWICEGLKCMAWKKAQPVPTTHEEMGYCGLAGEPQAEDRR